MKHPAWALVAIALTASLAACDGSSTVQDPISAPDPTPPDNPPPAPTGTFPDLLEVGEQCSADCDGEAIGITCAAGETPVCDCDATPRTECDGSEAS